MDFTIDESEDKYEVHLSTLATTKIKKSHVNEALKNLLATDVRDQLLYHANPTQTSSMGILSNIDLALTEAYKSAMISHHLRNFLSENAMVFHRGPCGLGGSGHAHLADIYICTSNGNLPDRPVLVSDIKKTDGEKSIMESSCYAMSAISTVSQNDYPVVLSLPIYQTTMSLRVCFAINGKLCEIEIAECSLANAEDSKRFLAILYSAVDYLVQNVVTNNNRPLPSRKFIGEHITSLSDNGKLFLIENRVHKLFSKTAHAVPNVDIIHLINEAYRFKNVEVSNVDEGGRYLCMSYDFIDGDHEPKDLRQFKNIFMALDSLHKSNFVHGDVRLENMVFTDDIKTGYLIDYDFSGKEGELYPKNYNGSLEGRHNFAQAEKPMSKKHDRFSLAFCVHQYFKDKTAKLRQKIWMESTPLSEITCLFLEY